MKCVDSCSACLGWLVVCAVVTAPLAVRADGKKSAAVAERPTIARKPAVAAVPSSAAEQEKKPAALIYARRNVERLQKHVQTVAQRAERAAAKANEAEKRVQAAENRLASVEKTLGELDKQLKQTRQEQTAVEKQLDKARETLTKAGQAEKEAAERLAQAVKQKNRTASQPAVARGPGSAEQTPFETASRAVEEARQAKQDAAQKASQAKQAVEQAEKQVQTAAERLKELDKKKQQATSAKQAAAKKLTSAKESLKPLQEENKAEQQKLAKARKKLEAARRKLTAFEQTPPQADPQRIREIGVYKHDRPMISCRFDGTGRFLLAGAQDRALQRWDLLLGSHTELKGHRSWVRRFDLHPQTDRLVSGDYSGQVIWWDALAATPEPLRTVQAHQGYVRAVAFSPDGRYVATGGNDNLVKVFSADDGRLIAELPGHENHVYNVAFHPDGRHLVSGDLMGVLKQWEVGAWEHVRDLDAGVLHKYDNSFEAHCGGIRGMDFSPDGKQLVVCGIGEVTNAFAGVGKPTAALFDWDSGERVKVMKTQKNNNGTMWSIQFHSSGDFIVGAGGRSKGAFWFWKPGEEKSYHRFGLPKVAYDVAFHPDGLRLAAALYDKTVRVYDLGPKLELAQADEK